jgi:hypothetical protein
MAEPLYFASPAEKEKLWESSKGNKSIQGRGRDKERFLHQEMVDTMWYP